MNNSKPLTIALAQISVNRGDVPSNTQKHLQYIEKAAQLSADYIVFPELSLTGYEPDLASSLAFDHNDVRLQPIAEACTKWNITAVVGAPIRMQQGVAIGEYIVFPSGNASIYTKRYLHTGEEVFFVPGTLNPTLVEGNETLAFAICADTNNPAHSETASNNRATTYIASVFISPGGYAKDTAVMQAFAEKYKMSVFMANFSGRSSGYESAGGSAVWDRDGREVARLDGNGEGMLVVRKNSDNCWEAMPAL